METKKKDTFFDRLQKLFGTNILLKTKEHTKIRNLDINKLQTKVSLESNHQLYRHSGFQNSRNLINTEYTNQSPFGLRRIDLYKDYEEMDRDPILSSALNLYSYEAITKNEYNNILEIKTENDEVKDSLENLFYDILNIEFNLFSWARNLVKYGDFFLKLNITEKIGIVSVIPLSAYAVYREEDPENPEKIRFKYDETLGVYIPNQWNKKSSSVYFEDYEVVHFRLISDSNYFPYGKCLTSKSYIETEFGCKPIINIKEGENVWSFNNKTKETELTKVIKTVSSGLKDILQIRTAHNELKCSYSHPVLIYDSNKNDVTYKQADELIVGDLLVMNNNTNLKSKQVKLNKELITTGKHNGWQRNLHLIPDYITPEFARLFGFLIGDGWLSKNMNAVYIALGVREDRNNYYINLLEKFGHKSVRYDKLIRSNGISAQAIIDSKLLAEILYVNGFKGKAKTKRLPEWIYECDEYTQMEFIRGLSDADAHVFTEYNINRYNLELANEDLIYDVKYLLNRLNIKCSHISKRGYNGKTTICGVECNCSESFQIYYYLDNKRKTQAKKYNKLNNLNIRLEPITKIKKAGKEETYDIQVESENHNFIANGIVVHNSILEPCRKVWRQLMLLEDAMLIQRIMRAPERRIFKIDVGNIPPAEVETYMNQIKDRMKKVPYMNEETGDYDLRFGLQSSLEDFFIPVRGDKSGTSIDTLSGMEFTGIDDIEYLKNKMLAGLQIPKAFINYDENLNGKATLASEDVRFSRAIEAIQRVLATELKKIAIVHLYTQGFNDDDLSEFDLELTTSSKLAESERLELLTDKVDLFDKMKDSNLFSLDFIYTNIFNLSEEEYKIEQARILHDLKLEYRYATIKETGKDPEFDTIDGDEYNTDSNKFVDQGLDSTEDDDEDYFGTDNSSNNDNDETNDNIENTEDEEPEIEEESFDIRLKQKMIDRMKHPKVKHSLNKFGYNTRDLSK